MFVFVGWVFYSLVSVSFLIFRSKRPRILVTSESSGPGRCLCWALWDLRSLDWACLWSRWSLLRSLDLTWPPVKPESSSVVLRTSLASGRASGAILSTGVDCVWALWSLLKFWGRFTHWLVRTLVAELVVCILVSEVCWVRGRTQNQKGQGKHEMAWAWGRVTGNKIQYKVLAGESLTVLACVAWACLAEVFWGWDKVQQQSWGLVGTVGLVKGRSGGRIQAGVQFCPQALTLHSYTTG